MSYRLAKVNTLIQQTFAGILHKEADIPSDVMVTVSRVDTTPNLKSTTIWLYIFPLSREQEILESLKDQIYELQGFLNKALHMRPLPRIYLEVDHGASHADSIDQTLQKLTYEQSDETTSESTPDGE